METEPNQINPALLHQLPLVIEDSPENTPTTATNPNGVNTKRVTGNKDAKSVGRKPSSRVWEHFTVTGEGNYNFFSFLTSQVR
jgi:hypothetical protein